MSQVLSKRKINDCTPALKANELIRYTLLITSNEKHFKPCYRALTEDIVHMSENIFTKVWEAFNIRVKSFDSFKFRFKLQTEAILLCKNLLSLISIAYSINHLSSKRVEYWGRLVINTRNSIRDWRDSCAKKYRMLGSQNSEFDIG